MDTIAGLVILFMIFGLIERFSKGARRNRSAAGEAAPRTSSPKPVRAAAAPERAESASLTAGGAMPRSARSIRLANAARQAAKALELTELPKAAAAFSLPTRTESTSTEPETAIGTDSEGCVGGSIEHDQHEGESQAEHGRHLKRMEPASEEKSLLPTGRRLSTADLRRAVVMSEILDRPKALRKNHM